MTHAYADFQEEVNEAAITQLATLAAEQIRLEAQVEDLQLQLRVAQGQLADVSEHKIPELMDAAGVSEFRLKSGFKISVKTNIRANITGEKSDDCFAWLEENGQGRVIKREFKIEFGKEEEGWANRFQADLNKRKKPLHVKRKKFVHPQTLDALVREQLESGTAFPQELFGVYRQRQTRISSTG